MFVSHMELLNVVSLLSVFEYFCSRYYGCWLLAASLRGHSTARTWTMMLLHKDLVLITVFSNVSMMDVDIHLCFWQYSGHLLLLRCLVVYGHLLQVVDVSLL